MIRRLPGVLALQHIGGVSKSRCEAVGLKLRMLGEDVILGGAACGKFEQALDGGGAFSRDARLAAKNLRAETSLPPDVVAPSRKPALPQARLTAGRRVFSPVRPAAETAAPKRKGNETRAILRSAAYPAPDRTMRAGKSSTKNSRLTPIRPLVRWQPVAIDRPPDTARYTASRQPSE